MQLYESHFMLSHTSCNLSFTLLDMHLTQEVQDSKLSQRSPRVSSGGGGWSKPGEEAGNHSIIMAKPRCTNNIYDQITMTTTVDQIINVNALKAPWMAKS